MQLLHPPAAPATGFVADPLQAAFPLTTTIAAGVLLSQWHEGAQHADVIVPALSLLPLNRKPKAVAEAAQFFENRPSQQRDQDRIAKGAHSIPRQ